MVVIDKCFHLNVVCYALDYLVEHGDMDNDVERRMMAQAIHLSKAYRKELEDMQEYRRSLI